METAITVIGVVFSVYTVVSRIVPTSKTLCLIGIVINAAKAASDALDRRKK
jgi:hypothetical protein